jgi:NAD-dependent dihydropyrimidine dehydrogenase PreA subunit
MRREGIFIAVEVDDGAAADPELTARLSEACPVDIYSQRDGNGLEIVQENLDECVLCRLCLDASPAGAVRVIKLYDEGALLA